MVDHHAVLPPDLGSEVGEWRRGSFIVPHLDPGSMTIEGGEAEEGSVIEQLSKKARKEGEVERKAEGSVIERLSKKARKEGEAERDEAESIGTRLNKTLVAGGDGSSASPAAPSCTKSTQLHFPPYPWTGNKLDIIKWQKDCRVVREMSSAGYKNNLPTHMKPNDARTATAVKRLADKEAVRCAGQSVVSVSSITHDGLGAQCSGMVMRKSSIDLNSNTYLIVTCSKVVCRKGKLLNPLPKISVVLPNEKTASDTCLVHVDEHYDIAFLLVSVDDPLDLTCIGPGPEYGEKVFVLGRDTHSSLIARNGEIKWLEESGYLGRNYYMFLSCEVPKGGSGGPVIDNSGNTRGMAFYLDPHPAVLSISTINTCIDMFQKFSFIARPLLGLGLRTIPFLDIQNLDKVLNRYDLKNGYIVDKVTCDSDAEKLGIKKGDVILSFNGKESLTLPQLEDHLLSLGWACLEKSIYTEYLERTFSKKDFVAFEVYFADEAC